MSRYIQDVHLDKPVNFVNFIMNDFLTRNSFTLSDWKGETAYRTGDAAFEGFKYLKWSYNNGVFHLEAWMKGMFGGESDLEGFVAIAQKKPYKSSLESLISILQQPLPEQYHENADGTMPQDMSSQIVIPVQTVDNQTAATLALVFGIMSIVLALLAPLFGFLCGCVGFSQGRMGKASSKAGMARAGKVCSIVGLSLSAAIYILNIILTVAGVVLF